MTSKLNAFPWDNPAMPTLLITCNAGKLGVKRQRLIAEIYKFSAARLTPSVYVIQTDCAVREVFKRLKPFIEHDESLYVSEIQSTVGHGDSDVNCWLETNLNGRTLH
ncbi:hypothetical protein [Pseudomonas syringae]|uniref:hypothetical protein n=1 Tax=Pseudomonas syringae TaxID=317 RepID=UPI001674E27D|nr:hypothetical protein [Pseudomonas syringae]MCK9776163.1 hypothetical protein [Pseudomonas syringae pv. syringae]